MKAGSSALVLAALTMAAVWPGAAAAQAAAAETRPPSPIVRAALDADSVVPGQVVVFSVTVLVPTWLPEAPAFPSLEMTDVAVRLPPESTGPARERVGDATWSGVRRDYHLYPMVPGRYEIPAQRIRVVAADPATRKPVATTIPTEAVAFDAVPPPGTEDLDPFIAARGLTLEQSLEPPPDRAGGEPGTLEAGGALTRIVTAEIAGASPMAIPPLVSALESRALAIYPREPVVEESVDGGSIGGSRREVVTYVGESGGTVEVPPIRLRWYSTKSEAVEVAELPGFAIRVDGPSPTASADRGELAPWIVLAALVVLSTGVALARLGPRLRAWRARRHAAYVASERFAFARVKAAARARRLGATLSALDDWTARLAAVPGEEERSLQRVLLRLGAAGYSAEGDRQSGNRAWSTLFRALFAARHRRRASAAASRSAGELPPLNPGQARAGR